MRSLFILTCVLLAASGFAAPTAKVPDLVAIVKSSDASQKAKADACRELARVGNRDAVGALAALLPDEKLSHMARYALETIPGGSVDRAFRDALPKLTGLPLVGVIGSIGVRRDTRAVSALTKLLRADDPAVTSAAARALGSIGTDSAAKALTHALTAASGPAQLPICEGLLRCAERFSASGRTESARATYDHLRALPQAHQVRTAAWRGAILARGQDGLPLLLEALRSADQNLFTAAVTAARELPGAAVTLALCRELPQLPDDNHVVLLQFLGTRGDPAAMPALLGAAAHHEPAVCIAALNAIGMITSHPANRDPELTRSVLPALQSLLFHFNPAVAQAAQNVLAALPGPAADNAILAMLAPANKTVVRLKGLELVARRRLTSALPKLFTIAAEPDPTLRVAAIKRIGELADAQQLPELLNLLSAAREPADIEAAEESLAAVSQRAPNREVWAEQLQSRWEGSPPAQRASLLRVFAAIGGTNALHAVRLAAGDSRPEIRLAAVRSLGAWSNGEGTTELLSLARSAGEPTERALALHTYLELAAGSELPATNRLSLCRDAAPLVKTDDEKKLLLASLGALRSPEALPLIQPLLDQPGLKDEAATALINVSEKILAGRNASPPNSQALEALNHVVQSDANSDLRKRAQKLLDGAQEKTRGT